MATTNTPTERLRRMINEPTNERYHGNKFLLLILDENYQIPDASGSLPGSDDYVETYDLNAAAADIWLEKSAEFAETQIDHQTIDATTNRAKWSGAAARYRHAMQMYHSYHARRVAKSASVKVADREI